MAIYAPPLKTPLQRLREAPEGRVVRKPVRSAGWDGAGDLAGGVDTAATVGYLLDYANNAAQFETLYVNGVELGDWDQLVWTPTYSNLTVGDGTVVARAVQIGNLATCHFRFTLGGSSAVGTNCTISAPVTASSQYVAAVNVIGPAQFYESGVTTFLGQVRLDSTTAIKPQVGFIGANYLQDIGTTSTIPFTWATGDVLVFSAIYEAA